MHRRRSGNVPWGDPSLLFPAKAAAFCAAAPRHQHGGEMQYPLEIDFRLPQRSSRDIFHQPPALGACSAGRHCFRRFAPELSLGEGGTALHPQSIASARWAGLDGPIWLKDRKPQSHLEATRTDRTTASCPRPWQAGRTRHRRWHRPENHGASAASYARPRRLTLRRYLHAPAAQPRLRAFSDRARQRLSAGAGRRSAGPTLKPPSWTRPASCPRAISPASHTGQSVRAGRLQDHRLLRFFSQLGGRVPGYRRPANGAMASSCSAWRKGFSRAQKFRPLRIRFRK